ncbi:PIG-L family deacetylase [Pseudochryseolinea flava]|uniref:LmbE family protein n=1 Tax=Pseudochryseolinea flava TaxID=2059302 RepID=A0A364XUV9_9BACT|nr:PIG-L family deacetylase [Pseudochryseolinea flava]RAV97954.1 LmbE family protein [Pseudochryseolinea flava]
MKRLFLFIFACSLLSPSFSQPTTKLSAGQIKLKLKKLNVLTSVLYVAAHPDDENTRVITAMANEKLAATAYLSMTRGDGGQNLIGSEIRDELGLIRTQELLAARRIDGGDQFFTRANDFGFSKSADETFRVWGKDEIMHDVIAVYRQFQPDVIITRFPPTTDAGHGHHTASAILAQEAFDISADKNAYPELASSFGVWQPKRLYTNTGRWWNKTINENTPGIIVVNIGNYNALLGESHSEIAARSRSQHKSQGFGSAGTRGNQLEFLEYMRGDRATKDIFDGINTTWSRVKGAEKVQTLVSKAIAEFDEEHPEKTVENLLMLRQEILKLEQSVWKVRKLKETEQLIQDCMALFIEAASDVYWASPGEKTNVFFELVNRSSLDITISKVHASGLDIDSTLNLPLKNNIPVLFKMKRNVASTNRFSGPYWLNEPHGPGKFVVEDSKMIGKPENDAAIQIHLDVMLKGMSFTITKPLIYKWTDPVKGELTRRFEVVPPVFVNLNDKVVIFPDGKSKMISVRIKSSSAAVKGSLRLQLPAGWRAVPEAIPFQLKEREEEQLKTFEVIPASNEITAVLKAVAEVNGKSFDRALQIISYDHLPLQVLMPEASAKLVRLNLKKEGETIAYIKGAGDDVPAGFRNMGYQVWEMKNDEVTAENLKRVDAVVLGIRALNTNTRIRFMMTDLMEYVKTGGTLVVQYNNNFDLETENFSPYPLKLSRHRVTEEDAAVRLLKPEHLVLNYPNKITTDDFSGWVQERGLYFPETWDPSFDAILSMNDHGEESAPKDGSLLIAKYGSGYYVYTGLSFFRELPEGVSGAYKLLANIVSLGKPKQLSPVKGKVKSR